MNKISNIAGLPQQILNNTWNSNLLDSSISRIAVTAMIGHVCAASVHYGARFWNEKLYLGLNRAIASNDRDTVIDWLINNWCSEKILFRALDCAISDERDIEVINVLLARPLSEKDRGRLVNNVCLSRGESPEWRSAVLNLILAHGSISKEDRSNAGRSALFEDRFDLLYLLLANGDVDPNTVMDNVNGKDDWERVVLFLIDGKNQLSDEERGKIAIKIIRFGGDEEKNEVVNRAVTALFDQGTILDEQYNKLLENSEAGESFISDPIVRETINNWRFYYANTYALK